ncbi:MAG TPA: HTTM domain-containing protein [Kofleriaceae bacterium]|nr:HTTM domain-containing protein [Kofleriaceae bacterium]
MSRLARAAAGWLAPAVPAERLAAVRVLAGAFAVVYLGVRVPHIASYASFADRHFAPVGVLSALEQPPPAAAVYALIGLAWLACLGFALGWRFRLTGPAAGILLLVTLSYANSWGQIFHTENALCLFVLVLGVTRAADATSLDARGAPPREPHARYGWPLRLLCLVVVATYFLAGIAKLRWGGPGWMGGTVLRDTIAADSLRKILLGSSHSPIAEALLGQAWLFRALAVLTLVVELGAPIALLHRRAALVWVLSVLAFHLGVVGLMAIFFPFPLSGVAFAPFFRAERVTAWAGARIRRFRARRTPAGSAGP